MRTLKEVLIDLIFHKLIKSVADTIYLLFFEFNRGLNLKVLLLSLIFEEFPLSDQACNASFPLLSSFVKRGGPMATIRIIAIRKFIRMYEVSLVLIFIVCLEELTCK